MTEPRYSPKSSALLVESWNVTNPPPMERPHFHNSFEVYYLQESNVTYLVDNHVVTVGQGDCVVINKEVPHQTRRSGNSHYKRCIVYFDFPCLASVPERDKLLALFTYKASRCAVISLPTRERQEVESIFWHLAESFRGEASPYDACYRTSLLTQLLAILNKGWDRQHSCPAEDGHEEQPAIENIIKYVSANYRRDIRLDELADRFGVSKSYICHRFKEATGLSVVSYVHHQRLRAALKLVEGSNLSMTDIAMHCGFNSISHFNRIFKRTTGLSPTEVRKRAHSQ